METIPSGFVEVTHDQFFAALHADKRDIMPRCADPTFTEWAVKDGGTVFGRTLPGWKYPGSPRVYLIRKDAP